MARILLILAAAATTASAFVFDDRTDTSLLEPRDKKILDPVLEDREDIDYYEDNIEDYNDSEELRRDLMFDNTQLSLGGGASKDDCVNPWECNRPCPIGYFRLDGMDTCHRWLECSDWPDLDQNRTYLTQGSMKRVFKTTWRGIPVILARVKRFKYYSFINNLRSLQPSIFVTQLVGACENPAWPEVVLEYHPRGRLGNLPAVLEMTPKLASPHLLMRLLVDYAAVLSVLHHREPEGARVLCDTWSLQKKFRISSYSHAISDCCSMMSMMSVWSFRQNQDWPDVTRVSTRDQSCSILTSWPLRSIHKATSTNQSTFTRHPPSPSGSSSQLAERAMRYLKSWRRFISNASPSSQLNGRPPRIYCQSINACLH